MPAHLESAWQKKKKSPIGLRMQLFSISHNLLRGKGTIPPIIYTHTMSLTLDLHKLGSIC